MAAIKYITLFPNDNKAKLDRTGWMDSYGDYDMVIHCHSSTFFFPEHYTPLSVKYALNGTEWYRTENTLYAVKDSHFLVFNREKHYESYIESESPIDSFVINFSTHTEQQVVSFFQKTQGKLLDDPFENVNIEHNYIERLYDSAQIKALLLSVFQLSQKFHQHKMPIKELMLSTLEALLQLQNSVYHEINTINALRPATKVELYKRLYYARDYIESCYAQDIALTDLSQVSMLSEFHLLRSFKAFFKVTPYQYLKQKRLKEAALLLKNTDLPVQDICSRVGFEESSSLCHAFNKRFGLSPTGFRS
jgi:AraC-like DNA-binding protein